MRAEWTVESFRWGGNAPEQERIISWQAPPLRFGVGATREIGHELRKAGIASVLLVTDPVLGGTMCTISLLGPGASVVCDFAENGRVIAPRALPPSGKLAAARVSPSGPG
jgi:hypothetical protein